MHILILATPGATEKIQTTLGCTADRCTTATTWSDALACLQEDLPDWVIVERAILPQLEPTALLKPMESGRWPPMVFIDSPTADAQDEILQAERLLQDLLPLYQVGELTIDTRKKRAKLGGRWVTLSPLQYRLLLTLVRQAGAVVSYRDLLQAVWGYDGDDNEARELLKFHVRQIRQRLGLTPEKYPYIRSARGFGYMLAPPGEG